MSAHLSDRDLLDRLSAATLADAEGPDPDDCEALAERLVAVGASAAAARWRSWGLLPPGPNQLQKDITEATTHLLERGEQASEAEPPLPETWRALLERIAAGAEVQGLEAQMRELMLGPLPGRGGLIGTSEQLLSAGAPRAALVVLDPLMGQAPGDASLCTRLAVVQRACGNAHQGELWSRLSLRAQPNQPLMWFQLARMLLDQQAIDEALECAEAGLGYAPGHEWGLKLRANALAASRGWTTYNELKEKGGLPDDPTFVADLDRHRQRWQGRRGLGGHQGPPPLPLDTRLRLRTLLRQVSSPVALVHGRSGGILQWLLESGAWSEPPEVLPLGSSDPLRIQALAATGFSVQQERSVRHLAALDGLDLIVVERPPGRHLPLGLGAALRSRALVLAPVGLLQMGGRRLGRHGGWELFAGAAPVEAVEEAENGS